MGVSGRQIVAVLGRGVVPADEPVLRADDRGAVHGDGLFETMHVRDGRPWLVDEHLARLARERYLPTPGGFDPAVHMSVYRDQTTGRAEYIGVGVSTLDTPDMRWEQACATAEDTDDLGGRMYVLLADHTAILIDRPPPRRGRRDLGVHSTGNLNFRDALAPRVWTGHRDVSTMPVEPEIWDLLTELHQAAFEQNPRPTL